MRRKYKIAINSLGKYNVFYSFWWLPFWIKSNSCYNTFSHIDYAKEYIRKKQNPVYLTDKEVKP